MAAHRATFSVPETKQDPRRNSVDEKRDQAQLGRGASEGLTCYGWGNRGPEKGRAPQRCPGRSRRLPPTPRLRGPGLPSPPAPVSAPLAEDAPRAPPTWLFLVFRAAPALSSDAASVFYRVGVRNSLVSLSAITVPFR